MSTTSRIMKFNKDVTSQRRKQRKALFQAPDHERGKHLVCKLSKDLRDKYSVKRITVITGDKVKVVSGHKDHRIEGEVKMVDRKKYRIHVEGAFQKPAKADSDATKKYIAISPANCIITEAKLYANRERLLNKNKK